MSAASRSDLVDITMLLHHETTPGDRQGAGMMQPVRLQLSRKKGFNLQALSRAENGLPATNVSRPGKWGNPFNFKRADYGWLALSFGCRGDAKGRQEASVKAFREWIDPPDGKRVVSMERQAKFGAGKRAVAVGPKMEAGLAPSKDELIAALRGKNLACWCAPGAPCHADVLLELANREPMRDDAPP